MILDDKQLFIALYLGLIYHMAKVFIVTDQIELLKEVQQTHGSKVILCTGYNFISFIKI